MNSSEAPHAAEATGLIEGTIETVIGRIGAVFSPRGLCRLLLPGERSNRDDGWARRWLGGTPVTREDERLAILAAELRAYLAGTPRQFTTPLDLRGTPFQCAVWEAVLAIPYGQTRTYAQIAAGIGRPRAVRAVGAANGANPVAIIVPCHRLVGSGGDLRGYGGGLEMKRRLLALESSSSTNHY